MTAADKPHHHDDDEITNDAVVVLGDHDTGQKAEILTRAAADHGVVISEIHTFDQGEISSRNNITEVEAVVAAVSQAISTRADVWLPFPSDLGPEANPRRVCLVLQRRGVNLRIGPHLWPCPTKGGINEVDHALRREVKAVDELDQAALALAGAEALSEEIARAIETARCIDQATLRPSIDLEYETQQWSELLDELETEHGPSPAIPELTADWRYRKVALKRLAVWLVHRCGLTQAAAARFINAVGHRTPHGRRWQQSTISALINGRYDRRSA